jgi:hypothetical protein
MANQVDVTYRDPAGSERVVREPKGAWVLGELDPQSNPSIVQVVDVESGEVLPRNPGYLGTDEDRRRHGVTPGGAFADGVRYPS